DPLTGSTSSRRTIRLAVPVVLGLAVLLVATLGFVPTKWWQRLRGPGPEIRSLAVLPLQNLSGDPGQEYFSDGMTEELITELSRISGLKVISRTSVMMYRKTDKSLPQIARELGVNGIVEGSVLRSGDRVRITAQLIYAPEDRNIWAETYDRDMHDVLTLQSIVANSIASEIRVQMKPGEEPRAVSSRPVNLEAREAYLEGRYHLQQADNARYKRDKGKLLQEESETAIDYFQKAIQKDPNYAPPYIGVWEGWQGSPLPTRDWVPRARPMVLKALQLDDTLADAHLAMAAIYGSDWKWTESEKEFRRAIQLGPSNAETHAEYSNFLLNTGRTQEGMNEAELAQTLDPKCERMGNAY